MKAYFILLSLSFCFIGQLFSQEKSQAEQLQQILDQDFVDGQFAGVVAAYAIGDQQVIVAAGQQDLEAQIPFETQSLNRIASIAKSMTAVAVLQLYEQGLIELDEPIASYLPNYPQRDANRISVRHLLQHSSGIGAYKSAKETESKKEFSSLSDAAAIFQDRDLVDEPGNAEHYTTYGYVVLGMIIEVVSGQTYEEYMQANIWDKADMKNTGVEHWGTAYENKSKLYHKKKRGRIRLADPNNLSNRVPGGGLYSTAEDLLKFGQAVLTDRLISESTFALMMENPGLPHEGNPYGMGWFLYGENPELGPVYGHTGGQTGCSSVLLIMPEKEAVIIVMSNTSRTLDHVFGIAILHIFPILKAYKAED
ncbi:MAG: serine hydrolase domain-containing protein [Bacteroidota bacterium]